MNWFQSIAQYKQLGQTWTVMRPALVMEFYGEGTKLVDYGKMILDLFMTTLPKQAQLFYIGNNSREYKPLEAASLRRIGKTLEELKKRSRFYMIKNAPEFEAGDFSIELNLGSDNPSINDSVHIALPLSSVEGQQLEQTVKFFDKFVNDIPFWGGVAGFGYNLIWGREFEMVGMPIMMKSAIHYHGLLIRERTEETYAVKKFKSAGWLTFLDEELTNVVGGATTLQAAVGKDVVSKEIRQGLMLRAGNAPPIGDVNRQDKDVAPLASVNRAISKCRIQKWFDPSLFEVPAENANDWLRRFD